MLWFVFGLGVVLGAAAVAALVDSVPFLMTYGWIFAGTWNTDGAWRDLESALGCAVLAFFCFRQWSRQGEKSLRELRYDGAQHPRAADSLFGFGFAFSLATD